MQALTAHADRSDGPFVADVPLEPLGRDDVRVEVAAAAINPFDLAVASGALHPVFGLPDAVGIGYDLAGTILEVGESVTDLAPGDRVAGVHADLAAPVRAHAAVATVPASAVALVPDRLDLFAAATVPMNALTAVQAVDRLGEPADRALLVTGGAGAVGGYAVALARRAGWRVTALARPSDQEFVTSAGAAELLIGLPDQPRFDAVLDAAALGAAILPAVADGGVYVGVNPLTPVEAVRGIDASDFFHEPDGARLASLLELAADGVLQPRVAGTTPLADAAAAYAKTGGDGGRGRWILIP